MRDVDTRCDVYSLGVLLYELRTGTAPFDKETLQKSGFDETRRIIREVDPPRPSARISTLRAEMLSTVSDKRKIDPRKLSASLRRELDWIVMRALEKDRNRRYESASAFAADIERSLNDEAAQACPPSIWYQFRKYARRRKGALAATDILGLALLVALGGIAGGVEWVMRDREARQSRLAAQVESILDDVDRLMQEQKWPEALAAANRAEAALESGDGNDVTQRRVRQVLADLKLVLRLEDARSIRAQWVDKSFDNSRADRAYARAFADAGLTIDGVTVEDAAQQLRGHSAILDELSAALTHWRIVRKKANGTNWRHLLSSRTP